MTSYVQIIHNSKPSPEHWSSMASLAAYTPTPYSSRTPTPIPPQEEFLEQFPAAQSPKTPVTATHQTFTFTPEPSPHDVLEPFPGPSSPLEETMQSIPSSEREVDSIMGPTSTQSQYLDLEAVSQQSLSVEDVAITKPAFETLFWLQAHCCEVSQWPWPPPLPKHSNKLDLNIDLDHLTKRLKHIKDHILDVAQTLKTQEAQILHRFADTSAQATLADQDLIMQTSAVLEAAALLKGLESSIHIWDLRLGVLGMLRDLEAKTIKTRGYLEKAWLDIGGRSNDRVRGIVPMFRGVFYCIAERMSRLLDDLDGVPEKHEECLRDVCCEDPEELQVVETLFRDGFRGVGELRTGCQAWFEQARRSVELYELRRAPSNGENLGDDGARKHVHDGSMHMEQEEHRVPGAWIDTDDVPDDRRGLEAPVDADDVRDVLRPLVLVERYRPKSSSPRGEGPSGSDIATGEGIEASRRAGVVRNYIQRHVR